MTTRPSRTAAAGPITDINVTPLVDVCLVLVIIFMVIAPFALQAGIEVASTRMGAAKGLAAVNRNVRVKIDAQGRLQVNEAPVGWDALAPTLRQALNRSVDKLVSLDAAAQVEVGEVVEVLDISKQEGARRLALLNQ